MRRERIRWYPILMVCASISVPAFAQEDIQAVLKRLDAVEKRVQQLEQQNQSLSQELAATRAGQPATPAAPAAPIPTVAATEPAGPTEHEHGAAPQGPAAEEVYPSLKIRGFADVDFSATDAKGQPSGFNLGQVVLHMSSPLSRKVSTFGELSFTARSNQYAIEVERIIVRYDANDHFKISFGKYHTPVNYWNTAFHHGSWLQTTISRPEMIQFGGRFLPVHFTGLLAEGAIPSGSLGLNYNVGLGNGRQTLSLLSRDGDAGDVNNNRAVVATVFARPTKMYGLQVGASYYRDLVSPDPATPSAAAGSFREWIASGHIVWAKENPEFISEVANVHHRSVLTGREWNSLGTYTQVAYRFSGEARKWKPYYRFEYIHAPATEPVLAISNLLGHTAGIRYDITDFAAFKMEYRKSERTPTQNINGLFLQTAFTF
jgi:hypothetical protein